ncbi:TSC22 domain family protein 4 isoform X2 [Sander lucioperca]|uniref:TSC22 domain family protein 4 isoform X2 n=1 Tax=Sander lucioperca TaxID=283035 RepID=UPI00125DF165|nr:TSC22 domain family protein 4 isoform X2 [Sander lucioperca]
MSGGKKRSGFQITSVTSDFNQSAASVSQGSSSQPTTPCLKRKYGSHDASGQGVGSASRFRVVRLAAGAASGRGETSRRGRWTCTDFMETQDGFRRIMDSMRHAHSLESLELIGRDADRGGAYSQPYPLEMTRGGVHSQEPIRGRLVLQSGPPSPTHPGPNVRILATPGFDSTPPPPSPRPRNVPPPLRLDVDSAGRSVLRLSHSQPSSPPAGPYHPTLTPDHTPAAFSLDQTFFNLPGDDSSSNSLIAIDNKIEQAMDLVKSHLMLAVREEVELLREQIRDLQEKNQQLQRENHILRTLTHNTHTLHNLHNLHKLHNT